VQEMMEHTQEYFREVFSVCSAKGEDKCHQDPEESPEMLYDVLSDDKDTIQKPVSLLSEAILTQPET